MKIFGIGLSKTGTTSLASALEILGYSTKDYPGVQSYVPDDLSTLSPGILEAYDAFTDTPIPSLYKALDKQYPGSKFILTIRDMDGWLKSCKKQFTEKHAANLNEAHHQLFMDLYHCTVFDEERFREGYERFTREVQEYFRDRPNDLLLLNVTDGEGWDKLCPFLGRPDPGVPFPKANVTQIRWMKIQDVIAIARGAGSLLPGSLAVTSETKPGIAARFFTLLSFYRGNLLGGKIGGRLALAAALQNFISCKLKELNPGIPIISPANSTIPYSQRSQINHLWLVDPLQCPSQAGRGWQGCCISIALIEDRKPICGVVYVPATDTVYYAALGKDAMKARGNAPVEKLHRRALDSESQELLTNQVGNGTITSPAVRLCQLAEGIGNLPLTLHDTQEWQTAAADTILRATGQSLRLCESCEALSYNKSDMHQACLNIG